MEQGTRLDSTPVSAVQTVRDDAGADRALDAAVAALLTAHSAEATAPAPDHELLRLGAEFDAAHAAWLDAVEANQEPTDRFTAFIDAAKARGGPTVKELEAAWALPGVAEAHRRDDETFAVVTDLGLEILNMPATSLAGLAVHARAVIPNVWELGDYEGDAELGEREDLPQKPVRALIQSVLGFSGVDWKGQPQAHAASVPAIQTSASDLATACVEQVKRLDYWGANPDAISEKQGDEEMDRWGAVFRRAIDEPSASPRDLAGKAYLMLADLGLFMPEDGKDYQTDNYRLMRVIMREAIAIGGLAYPGLAPYPNQDEHVTDRVEGKAPPAPDVTYDNSPDPILALIERHRQTYAEWLPHLDVVTELGVGTPEFDRAEADAADPQRREQELYGDLLTARPTTLGGLVAWASYLYGAVVANAVDDEDADGVRALASMCDAVLSLVPTTPAQSDGVAAPAAPPDVHAVLRAIQRHKEAKQALDTATLAADEVRIRNDGGDTSEAALEPLNAQWSAASNAYDQAYRDLIATRPQTLADLLSLLRYLAKHADDHRGMEDEPDVFGALIGAAEGLRWSEIVPAAGHDLSRLSIAELENLARIAHQEQEALMAIESMAFCQDRTGASYTPLGEIIETEGERFAFLSDYAVAEIVRRRPTNKDDANRRLEAMVRHHLTCNGYIEPTLMAEVVQAWGRA